MTTETEVNSLQKEVDQFLRHVHDAARVPGISVAISLCGKRIYSAIGSLAAAGQDRMTRDGSFQIGCLTKLLGSIVVLELARQQILDLDAPIQEYLSELRGTVHGQTVTLSHLLTHTSGYRGTNLADRETLALSWDGLVRYLRSAPQYFRPGSVFSYEHSEMVVAAAIIERVTGKNHAWHLKNQFELLGVNTRTERAAGRHALDRSSRVFAPIESTTPNTTAPVVSAMWEAAFSTDLISIEKLLAIGEFIVGPTMAEDEDGARRFPAATRELLHRPALALPPMINGRLTEVQPTSVGLGTSQWRDGFCGLGGSTLGQCLGLRFNATCGTAVAIGINALQPYLRDLIFTWICKRIPGTQLPSDPPENKRLMRFESSDVVGSYRGPGINRADVSLEAGKLVLCVLSAARRSGVRAELIPDKEKGVVLKSQDASLSVGFFREPHSNNVGLMIGVNAFKRVSGPTAEQIH